MRKKFLSMLLASAMVFSLVACGSEKGADEGNTSASTEETEETEDSEEIKLTWLHHFEEQQTVEWIDQVTAAYTEANPNVTFDIQYTGHDNYATLLKTKISGDDAPDIFYISGLAENAELVNNGYLLDLTDTVISERLIQTAIDGASVDGKIYSIPIDLGGFNAFYNKDVFDELGISEYPKTYTEFLDVCEKLEAAGVIAIGQGYGDLWTLNCDSYSDGISQQTSLEPEWFDKVVTRELKFSDNAGEVKSSWTRLKERYEYGQGDQFSTDWNTVVTGFAKGEIGMILNGSNTPSNVWASMEGAENVRVGSFAFPYSEDPSNHKYQLGATGGIVGFGGSEHTNEIVDFFDFMTQAEQAKMLAEARGSLSTIKGIAPEVNDTLSDIIKDYVDTDMIRSISSVNRDFPGEFQTIYYEVMSEFLLTDLSVDDAMIRLDEEFDRIASK